MDKALNLALHSIERMTDGFFLCLPNIIIAICAILAFVMIARAGKKVVIGFAHRAHMDDTLALALGTITLSLLNLFGLLVAATIVFPSFSPGNLVAGLGITSVAVGFAFKDILENFFAGILLLWQKPFAIGDVISTQSYEGTVEDIDIRSTRIRTANGEMVVMPNGAMISGPIVVLTGYGKRRVKMSVPVASAADLVGADEKILSVLKESKLVDKEPAPVVYRTTPDPANTSLDLYFWTDAAPQKMAQAIDDVARSLQAALHTSEKPAAREATDSTASPAAQPLAATVAPASAAAVNPTPNQVSVPRSEPQKLPQSHEAA